MKRIIYLSMLLFSNLLVSAQVINSIPQHSISKSQNTKVKITKKAPGDVFWYEDFANGVAGNSVDGSGNPIGGGWTRGFTGATDYSTVWNFNQNPRGQYEQNLPLLSESQANGWMVFDANYQTDQENNNGFITIDGYLESPVIDISGMGTTALEVEIQHSYRTCCSGAAYPVGIFVGYFDVGSGSWIWTRKNSGNNSHNLYPAPRTETGYEAEIREINITDVAQAASINNNLIKVRFHWNSELNASNSYYMWMIDDVRIKEIANFDASLTEIYTGDLINDFDYYAIPESQISNHTYSIYGAISNKGGSNLTGVRLNTSFIDVNTSTVVNTSSSSSFSLNAADETVVIYNTGFKPINNGVYDV
jgi:hypothetical protein